MTLPPIQFASHRLDNGLRIFWHRDNRVPLVHLTVHYRVGSSFEERGKSGFAHLFEHLMFQGSENVGRNEHGLFIDAAGGRWNATTSKDRTNYYETLPSHHLDLGLWLEADRMRSLKLTPENFENQRQTVIEEKKQGYDNQPYGLADLRFDELAYSNWAYAHPIIGSVEDLQKASLENAVAFHNTYYKPSNATLVLVGDIDESRILNTVESFFGWDGVDEQPSRPDLSESGPRTEKFEVMEDPLAVLPAAYVGYGMPGADSTDHYALSMLALVLSQGESSRLYQRLVYDNNWITTLSAGPNQHPGPQLFTVWFQIQNEVKTDDVLSAVDEELDRFRQHPISPKELDKARNQVLYRFVSSRNTVSRIGEALAKYAVLYDDPWLINSDVKRYLNVSPEEILGAARRTLRRDNRTLIVVEPGPDSDP